ncbi:putative RNA methyltransferase [Amphibacillus indicireducens]|uniref:Methyltransferase domain-containing protein n=1 Tax=Amphibacillus indicireducens TaxID=1076330 RepID=A0ABP7V0N6_9BACI
MKKESKKVVSARYIQRFESVFSCPVCDSEMAVQEYQCLVCLNHHSFDIAKQGYLNLVSHTVMTKYTKSLFESRQRLMNEAGFFRPVTDQIIKMIEQFFGKTKEPILMLDSGSGEGSHLAYIRQSLENDFGIKANGVGIDISKEAITVAAKHYSNLIWTVADLAKTPFKNQQFDLILNLLSPSNYTEFDRLLKPSGVVIKVVPGSDYLQELRGRVFANSDKQTYSNDETVALFKSHYPLVDQVPVTEIVRLDQAAMRWLIEMTPLTWNVPKAELQSLVAADFTEITLDVVILIGENM